MPFARIATPEFRIQAQWSFHELLAYIHSWSATRRCMTAIGSDFFESAEQRLAPLWGALDERRAISMPLHLIAGRVS